MPRRPEAFALRSQLLPDGDRTIWPALRSQICPWRLQGTYQLYAACRCRVIPVGLIVRAGIDDLDNERMFGRLPAGRCPDAAVDTSVVVPLASRGFVVLVTDVLLKVEADCHLRRALRRPRLPVCSRVVNGNLESKMPLINSAIALNHM